MPACPEQNHASAVRVPGSKSRELIQVYEELELFTMLIGISGIGPRSALGIIGLESIEKLVGAIAHGDVGYLTKVSGVGKKSAEEREDKARRINPMRIRRAMA